MSQVSYQSFLSSRPFLVIGPQGRWFYAHAELLAQISDVLAKDIHGNMVELETETIEISDVDEDLDDDTIMRFIEFAYTGDYTTPEPAAVALPAHAQQIDHTVIEPFQKSKKDKKKRSRLSEDVRPDTPAMSPTLAPLDEDNAQARTGTTPSPIIEDPETSRTELWSQFCARSHAIKPKSWRPKTNNTPYDDYAPVFLCHARLYKFSDRYNCPKLTELSLQKLRLTLSRYLFHKERVCELIELLVYTYRTTMEYGNGQDQMRSLILEYVTCYIKQFMQDSSFRELLRDDEMKAFCEDLMVRMMQVVL